MSMSKKLVGLLAGASAVAALGVAVAQDARAPVADPTIRNQPLAPDFPAGQQSTHRTSMGETGVLMGEMEMRQIAAPATVAPEPVAAAPAPAPAPVAAAPAPAPEPVAAAPAPAPVAAAPAPAPAPVEQVAQAPAPRADRN